MDYKFWNIKIENRVATIIISNPPLNILTPAGLDELERLVAEVSANTEIKVAIITGSGNAFIAGVDIKEIMTIQDAQQGTQLALRGQRIFRKIEQSSKPFIAAINGICLGAGLEMALACQLRICSENALLGLPEINIGIIPGYGGSQRLPRLTNKAKAIELILTGDKIPAADACAIGLVNHVVPNETLLTYSNGLAKKIAAKSGLVVAKVLQAITQGLEMNLETGLAFEAKLFGEVCESEDIKEGVAAFLQKRPPEFKDK